MAVIASIEELAEASGVTVVEDCDTGNGGRFGYYTTESPDCTFVGYKTRKSAYRGWFVRAFGRPTAQALTTVFKELAKLRETQCWVIVNRKTNSVQSGPFFSKADAEGKLQAFPFAFQKAHKIRLRKPCDR